MKKTSPEREKGKPPQRKYDCFPIRQDLSSRATTIILPGLPAVCDGLFHSWIGRSDTAFRLRLKGTAKKKNRQKPVKAPLWHKHKRNGPRFISLKR